MSVLHRLIRRCQPAGTGFLLLQELRIAYYDFGQSKNDKKQSRGLSKFSLIFSPAFFSCTRIRL